MKKATYRSEVSWIHIHGHHIYLILALNGPYLFRQGDFGEL